MNIFILYFTTLSYIFVFMHCVTHCVIVWLYIVHTIQDGRAYLLSSVTDINTILKHLITFCYFVDYLSIKHMQIKKFQ